MLWPVVLTLAAFLTNSYAFTAEEDKVPAVPSVLREFNDRILRAEAYHNLPWSDLANFNFFPREFFAQPPSLETPDLEDYDGTSPGGEEEDDLSPTRTSTASKAVFARSTFTFICPTSVQCNDGGCCPLGDYCALRNGQEGCCPLGSLCDASPIPGCSVSCYGTCCDTVPNIIGEPVCSPTPGAGGQASGTCTGVAPSNPLYTLPGPSSCLAGEL